MLVNVSNVVQEKNRKGHSTNQESVYCFFTNVKLLETLRSLAEGTVISIPATGLEVDDRK